MRRVLTGLLILSTLTLLASFAGRLHAAGDTLAVIRPLLVLVVGVLAGIALVFGPRLPGAGGLILAVAGGVGMVPHGPASELPDGARHYSAYQKNLLWNLPDKARVARDIGETEPDFVMLQELHQLNRPILDMLRRDYPHQQFCPFATVGGTAVLSRWPPTEEKPVCDDGYGLAAMQVATPDGPTWIVSLHLHWPFPYGQRAQLDTLLPVLERLDGPIIVGGDFNMVPWAFSVAAVKRATRTTDAGYAGGTFAFSYRREGRNLLETLPPIPIDHILVPQNGMRGSLTRRDRLGSDHHGLVATFTIASPANP